MNKRTTLSLALAMEVAALAAGARASDLEEVVVTVSPIRDSQKAAIEAKRDANHFMDVVSADSIGRFPDQNLADSLGRVPGLAIERDQGQARYINLRGAPFRYTSIAFDGIDVPGAENGRIPRFDSFPSVITSRVEVNKAILPSMVGESVAGHVNIHTFNPFDREGLSLDADLGQGRQSLGDGDIEKYSLRGSWSNERFGALIFGSNNSREQITDNREYDLDRDPESGELVVNELDFRSYKVEREDKAWGGHLEYRGEGSLQRVFVSTLYSEFVDEEQRNQYVFGIAEPRPGLAAESVPVSVNRSLEFGEYSNSTFTNTLGGDLRLGEWSLEGRYNYTETEFDMNLPMPYSLGAGTTASYDLSEVEDPRLELDTPLEGLEYATNIGIHYVQNLEVDADKIKLDASRELTLLGLDTEIQVGAQYDTREATGHVANAATGGFPAAIDIGAFDTGELWETAHTTNTIGGTYYDNPALLAAARAVGAFGPAEIASEDHVGIEEDILAAYAMATVHYGWGNVVFGSRLERTDYVSEGTVEGQPVRVGDEFTDVLPSVHFNFDLAPDLKLRVSASSGVNRPTYEEWRAAASVDVTNREVRGGNPDLKAEEARGLDTSLEWYFAPASLVSAGAYYRQIDNVIYADATTVDGGTYLPSAAGEEWDYIGTVNGDDGEMRGVELNLVAHAEDLGLAPLAGFGFSGNVTVTDSEFTGLDGTEYDLPGTSDLIYNASLFYENNALSVRLNYQYRDEWISPIEDPSEYWGEQERMDLSVLYTLPMQVAGSNVTLYLNANNLTDETDVRYAGNDTINQSESFGRRYLMGVRFSY